MVFRVSHAAVAGTDHILRGIPCQDSIHLAQESDITCLALADGAGSRSASHLGAQAVTRTLSRYICAHFSRLYEMTPARMAQDLLEQALSVLSTLPYALPELASTLLFFAADARGKYITGHLGDGLMLALCRDEIGLYSAPDNAQLPTVTWFTTSRDAQMHFRIQKAVLPETGAMLLMSDGCAPQLYDMTGAAVAPACKALLAWHRDLPADQMQAVLEMNLRERFAPHTHDDLSLAIISW